MILAYFTNKNLMITSESELFIRWTKINCPCIKVDTIEKYSDISELMFVIYVHIYSWNKAYIVLPIWYFNIRVIIS